MTKAQKYEATPLAAHVTRALDSLGLAKDWLAKYGKADEAVAVAKVRTKIQAIRERVIESMVTEAKP